MAVEAAIEALQATSDLVSQPKMGQLLKPLRLFHSYQIFLLIKSFLIKKKARLQSKINAILIFILRKKKGGFFKKKKP